MIIASNSTVIVQWFILLLLLFSCGYVCVWWGSFYVSMEFWKFLILRFCFISTKRGCRNSTHKFVFLVFFFINEQMYPHTKVCVLLLSFLSAVTQKLHTSHTNSIYLFNVWLISNIYVAHRAVWMVFFFSFLRNSLLYRHQTSNSFFSSSSLLVHPLVEHATQYWEGKKAEFMLKGKILYFTRCKMV